MTVCDLLYWEIMSYRLMATYNYYSEISFQTLKYLLLHNTVARSVSGWGLRMLGNDLMSVMPALATYGLF